MNPAGDPKRVRNELTVSEKADIVNKVQQLGNAAIS